MAYKKMHTRTLRDFISLFLEYQIDDSNWRLSKNQCEEIQEIKEILKSRN